jgi:hypothetical protein
MDAVDAPREDARIDPEVVPIPLPVGRNRVLIPRIITIPHEELADSVSLSSTDDVHVMQDTVPAEKRTTSESPTFPKNSEAM